MTALPAVAEDVTQDVFLAVIRDAGRYQPGRSTVTALAVRDRAQPCAAALGPPDTCLAKQPAR